jgi:hypothetical protein
MARRSTSPWLIAPTITCSSPSCIRWRRRAHRRRDGRNAGRDRPPHLVGRVPTNRPGPRPHRARRRRGSAAAGYAAIALVQRPASAGGAARGSAHGLARDPHRRHGGHPASGRASGAHRQPMHGLGRGRGSLAAGAHACGQHRHRGGPRRPGAGAGGPEPAGASRDQRHRRSGAGAKPSCRRGPKRGAGGVAGGQTDGARGGGKRPAPAAGAADTALPLQRLGQPGDHRPAFGGSRPVDPAGALSLQRHLRLDVLAVRPHLLPDRFSQPPGGVARLGHRLLEFAALRAGGRRHRRCPAADAAQGPGDLGEHDHRKEVARSHRRSIAAIPQRAGL